MIPVRLRCGQQEPAREATLEVAGDAKPLKMPPKAADCRKTKTNWNAV